MDTPRDPGTPFAEVYQSFLDDLVPHGREPSTIDRYRYNIVRFETCAARPAAAAWWIGRRRQDASRIRPVRVDQEGAGTEVAEVTADRDAPAVGRARSTTTSAGH